MRQDQFIARHEADWQALAAWLDVADQRKPNAAVSDAGCNAADVPGRYRRLCQQLALARRRGYSPMLIERLGQLVERTHTLLYRPPNPRWWRAIGFIVSEFPAEVRAQWGWMLASGLLFFLPFFAMIVAVQVQPELAHSVFDIEQLAQMEQMYDPARTDRIGRDSGTDLMMFGHYIMNNISIAFKCFAGGIFLGLGSLFFLAYNGIAAGSLAGYLTARGHGETFYSFVVTHGAFELTAIVLAGAAGLRLGHALLAPGRRTRRAALELAAREAAVLIYGVIAMLLIAAAVEAFWSSARWIVPAVKYGVGGACWALVIAYLAGQGRPARATPAKVVHEG